MPPKRKFETNDMKDRLTENGGNIRKTSQQMGISRQAIYDRLRAEEFRMGKIMDDLLKKADEVMLKTGHGWEHEEEKK